MGPCLSTHLIQHLADGADEPTVYHGLNLLHVSCRNVGDGPGRLLDNVVSGMPQELGEHWQRAGLDHHVRLTEGNLLAHHHD